MADDLQVEEFNRGDSAQDDRLRPGDGGTAGGPNTNADLREKGDADDIAEAVIQGDAESAVRDVGLRSDSPVDLTREEVDRNPQQVAEDDAEGPIADQAQQSRIDDTVETKPLAQGSAASERNITERTVSRAEGNSESTGENQGEPVAPAAASGDHAPTIAPDVAIPAAEVPETAPVEAETDTETVNVPKERPIEEIAAEKFVQTGETFIGGEGDDSYIGSNRGDYIMGGAGNDVLHGGRGKDFISGDDGDDKLFGGDGDDTLVGGAGDDYLDGGSGNDILAGGDGDDTLVGGTGRDHLDGGEGSDIYQVSGNDGQFDTIADTGTEGVDTLQNTGDSDLVLNGFSADNGIDIVDGNNQAIRGDNKGNTLDFSNTELQDVTGIHGGSGKDTIIGSDGDDRIFGEGGNDTLVGGAGDDVLDGGSGNDTIIGGEGDDTLIGGTGRDHLDGGEGSDIYQVSGNDGQFDTIADTGTEGVDTLQNTGDSDLVLNGFSADNGIDIVDGNNQAIRGDNRGNTLDFSNTELQDVTGIYGGGGKDTIIGSDGDDRIFGEGGNDTLVGGSGNDLIDGGSGNDTLIGGAGDDTLVGGAGKDTFVLDQNFGNDVIADFEPGRDTIDLAALGIDGFDTLMLHAGMDGENTVIKTDHGSVTLNGVSLDDLSADDFVFKHEPVDDNTVDTAADTISEPPVVTDPPAVEDPPVDTTEEQDATSDQNTSDVTDNSGSGGVGDGQDTTNGDDQSLDDTTSATGGDSPQPVDTTDDPAFNHVGDSTDTTNQDIDGGNGQDSLHGGAGDDDLSGDNGADMLDAGAGDDILNGGNGTDTLDGGAGNDQLDGGNGKDVLNGGAGDDILTGGNGNDTFSFDQNFGDDVITDFEPGKDQLDLSELGIPDMETLLDNATMNGDDTVITTDDGTITLSDTNLDDLSADDFTFGDAPADTTTDAGTDTVESVLDDIADVMNDEGVDASGDNTGSDVASDTSGTGGDAQAADTDTTTSADTADTGGSVGDPAGSDTGTGTNGDTSQTAADDQTGDNGQTGGDTGGVATQPDTTGPDGDAPTGDTGTGTTGDTATTGGDTGGVATQPDTTGPDGDAPAGDTGAGTTGGAADPVVEPVAEDLYIDGGNGKDTLEGDSGNDVLDGGNGKDILNGGAGDDTLTGGNGNDTFAFDEGFGNDVISDFKPGNDQIDLSNVGVTDLPSLLANAEMDGNDTVITTDEGTIRLSDVDMNDLSADDFVFGDAPVTDNPTTADTGNTGGDADTPATDPVADTPAQDTTAEPRPDATGNPGSTGNSGNDGNSADNGTGGDMGGVATQPDTTGTGGEAPAGDTGTGTTGDTATTGGDTGGVATQPDTTGTGGEAPAGDTGTGTTGDTATTGGDTGGVATQPDTTGTGGEAPAGDTSTGTTGDTATTGGDTGGVATQPDNTGTGTGTGTDGATGGDQQTGGSGQVPPVADTPVAQPPAPTIEGDSGSNDIDGSSGVDVVDAGSGNDKVDTGAGDDIVNAGTGNDHVKGGDGNDIVDGGTGNDRLEGGDGADVLTGGEGTDTLYGGDGGDTLDGGEGSDYLNSGKGDDVISGGSGNDKALGGDGNDAVDGGEGNDKVYGNDGNDTVSGGAGDDRAYGGQGDDIVSGGDGNDQVHGNSGNDILDGGAGNDRLHGGSGEDRMDGGDGTDRLSGGSGSDIMDGGAGEDRLYGGSGDDVIDGGAGDDYLKGDSGADTFTFSGEFGNDFISDFDVRESDAIDLSQTEIGDFRTLMDNSRQDGNDTVIELDGGTITLNDVDRNDLSSDNFSFAEGAGMELSEPGSVHEIPDLPAYDSLNVTAETANGVDPNAVTVSSAQTVTMTFEGETAGYQSSVGHYTVDADGVIQGVEMAWENASVQGGGGDMVAGEEQVSFDVDAGARVGVFVVPNGHRQNDFEDMQDGHFEFRDDAGEPATINTPSPTLVFVHEDGNETVINSQSGEIFHSAGPDMHSDSLEHSISGVDDNGDLMIGFEDLVGGGDESYDDLVVKLEFEPIMDEAAPAAEESAFSDGSGGGAQDMVSTDFDFVDDVSDGEAGGDEAVFNLDFTDLIPEGADEGQFEVRVSGLPSQVSSSKGEVDSDRNWTLTMMQVVGLTIAVPTVASASELLEDINFQVVDTESDQVVAEGLLDGDALQAGETTISVVPQIVEEERGNRGRARGHEKQDEKAAAEEAEAVQASPVPADEEGTPAPVANHAAAPDVVPEVELDVVEEIVEEIDEIEEIEEQVAAQPSEGAVAEANVAPTDLTLDTSMVLENAANGAVVGTVSATDANSGDSFTYSLVDDANGRFAIDPNTGQITVADASQLDYETDTSHDLTVKVTDSGGASYDEVMTIGIGDAGDPPTGASVLTFAVGENTWWNGNALNGSVNVTDPDAGDTFTFSMVDDAGGRFSIDADGTIRIADKSLLDYETSTSHDITFRITDSTGNTFDHTHTIHLYDENDTPTDLTLSANTVAENAANGTVVGTVTTTDQDAGETFTYTLVNDQGGRFAIDANTGVVTVADSSLIDYETATSHNLTIRVTDSGGATYDEVMAVNLTNANEAPTDLKLTNVEIAEGAANGTVVGTAAGTDADAGDTATYSLINNAGGRFTINSSTGEITVADGSLLDYESNTSHDITVRITDGGGNTYDETFTIGVNDEREEANTLEAEIVSHNPVGYWELNEVNSGHGTYTMAPTVGDVDVTSYNGYTGERTDNQLANISGNTTDFDGSDDYMTVADDPAWDLTDGSIQFLFSLDNLSGTDTLLSRSDGGAAGSFYIDANGDDLTIQIAGPNGGTLTAANVLTVDTMAQLTMTFGAGGLEIWLDGTRVAHDPTITQGIDGLNIPFTVGAYANAHTAGVPDSVSYTMNGTLHQLAIFDSQLDSAAINDIHDAAFSGHDVTAPGSATTDADIIQGTSGNDVIGGHNGDDFIYGGDGDDTIDGGSHDDVISGGAGTDTVDYSGFGGGVTVNLTTGTATDGGGGTDTLSGIENVLGTGAGDDITGNDADNVLTGYAGNDTLRGEDGDDTLYGGAGNDTLTGGAGDDLLQGGSGDDNMDGGAGTDTVTYDGAANGVTVNLATGTATDGVGDTDTLTSIENLIGSANDDTFTGNGSVNELTGGDGNDRFIMGEGGTMDTVHGGTGGGWTDTLQLMNTDSSSVASGWTVQLTTGSVQSDDGSTMTLTDDAAGTITLDDGSQIAFDGLERIEY